MERSALVLFPPLPPQRFARRTDLFGAQVFRGPEVPTQERGLMGRSAAGRRADQVGRL